MPKNLPENERKAVSYLRLAIKNLAKARELSENAKVKNNITLLNSSLYNIIFTILNSKY